MTPEAAVWIVKFAHLTAVAVWIGGLIAIPFLMLQRTGLEGDDLYRLQRMTRFLYVALASPAAFVAIGSGTALIFLAGVFVEWFTLKLVLAGALAALHVLTGLRILRVFEAKGGIGRPAAVALTAADAVAVLAILWVVLAKPALDAGALAGAAFAPDALGPWVASTPLSPSPTP
jgi:putative membrane protein